MALNKEQMLDLYRQMRTIREFEETVANFFSQGQIPGFVHLYIGEEAVATGVCANLEKQDYIASTHRGHGHAIARGASVNKMMAEIFGKIDGFCKGKGGSMHIADIELGFLGANGIVGAGLPLATGAGFALKYMKKNGVAICFFGDAASNRGTFHESLNMASIQKLPVVFVNENNGYGISMSQARHQNIKDIADRASAYGMPGVVVDGNDVMAVYEAAEEAVKRARAGGGPILIECKTYRHHGHFEGDPTVYRTDEEVNAWKAKDPLPRFASRLQEMKMATEAEIKQIDLEVKKIIADAVEYAQKSPVPSQDELLTDVYCN
ncbi:Acetoin dehydrogenase E1 component alpha-subunit [Desulfosporosinus sp. I2]|uniref:Pyruvate dehydrogenase E1 component subunit alpha n=1 Tax=Desulfosporosinus metallidurans TaxID=1888891 RepID=A0A1Q8QYQ1_9FIRM|nr:MULTISPECIES: pyruvate dehydrogenase (acetyl-transferring) E1 component subunit alpha [Desulfosporosinus]KJR49160.1 Acetoin dehydrogenase E1 component alpha-subunit [Desulfosporosinus sp. I2]OLN32492.1 Acetoin dehydrogenase E1 component alpha-subunit [Desulfosporosinus metallidurans]